MATGDDPVAVEDSAPLAVADGVLLSVITVTLRNPEDLRRTLASLGEQTCAGEPWWEVVVVSGDTDLATRAVLDAFRALPLRAVAERDDGIYDAMNKGTALARGRYVQYVNSGDVLRERDALALVGDALRRAAPTWLVTGAFHEAAESRIANLPHRWLAHAVGLQPHCHQACVFRRDLVDLLGGYDARFGFVADFDLILRAGAVARPFELTPLLVGYQGGGTSDRREGDIPAALAAVRRERWSLSGATLLLDGAVRRAVSARHRAAHAVTRLRSGRRRLDAPVRRGPTSRGSG